MPLPEGIASTAFADQVREETGVIVMPGAGFGAGGEGFFRISFIQSPARIAEAAAVEELVFFGGRHAQICS